MHFFSVGFVVTLKVGKHSAYLGHCGQCLCVWLICYHILLIGLKNKGKFVSKQCFFRLWCSCLGLALLYMAKSTWWTPRCLVDLRTLLIIEPDCTVLPLVGFTLLEENTFLCNALGLFFWHFCSFSWATPWFYDVPWFLLQPVIFRWHFGVSNLSSARMIIVISYLFLCRKILICGLLTWQGIFTVTR